MADQVRWFDTYGKCACGKAGTGILRGIRNESYGIHCKPCATRRLKAAEKEREAERRLVPAKKPRPPLPPRLVKEDK